jgi:predicted DsbA family dithiol-disulfide isomerase
VLLDLAEEAGLDRGAAARAIADPRLRDLVIGAERRAGELGVSGVPFFIVDEAWAVSGAQPPAAWIEAFRQMARGPEAELRPAV